MATYSRSLVLFIITCLSLTHSYSGHSSKESLPKRSTGNVEYVETKTESGTVRGSVSTVQAGRVVSYFGIPYAKAPIGDRRFAAPERPAEPWSGVRDALEPGFDCYSLRDDVFPGFIGSEMWNGKTEFSEDCLNLNIWAPHGAANATVMVWIFGGGFYSGSPSLDLYDGGVMAAEGNVVVVAINYRLGPLGFLNLGDETANIGLLDQQAALKWVNRNVHNFGGDPNQVTLFGESAGAVSVSAHLLAPDSQPLFRYAVLQSGAVSCPWATKTIDNARQNAYQFLDRLSCSNGTDQDRVKCAKRSKVQDLLRAYRDMAEKASFMEYQFVPLEVDSTFFRGNVHKLLAEGRVKNTALIIGTVADEGTFWLPYFLSSYFNNQSEGLIDWYQYRDSVEQAFSQYYFHQPLIRKAIAYHYLWSESTNKHSGPWRPSKTLHRNAIARALGDYFFTCKTLDFADSVSKNGGMVYAYYFNERSTTNPWPLWMGVMHGYEIEYIFGVPLRKQEAYTIEEVEFSRRMVQYWANFAKHGKPIPESSHSDHHHHHHVPSNDLNWPVYGPRREYLILQSARTNPPTSWIEVRHEDDDCGFWRETTRICHNNDCISQQAGFSASNSGTVHGRPIFNTKSWPYSKILTLASLLYVFLLH